MAEAYPGQRARQTGRVKAHTGPPPPGAKARPQGVPRVWNKASQKMETRNQMQHYHRPSAAARALGAPKHVSGTGPAHVPAAPFNPLGPNSTPAQIQHWATKTVAAQEKGELAPFQARRTELGGEEGATVGRYQGYAQAQQGILGGIQAQNEVSAKTYGNEAAEAALRSSKEIETTGQNAANANAGYMDPQLKAALASQQANVHATGQAREAAVAQTNQAEAGFLANMRAAAAQRATEGQQQLQGGFQKQRGELGAKEGQIRAGKAGAVSKLYTEALQKQFTNKATEAGLGLKVNALQQKGRETGARVGATIRGQNISAGNAAAGRATTERGQNIEKEAKEAALTYKETHPTGKSTNAPKAANLASARKYAENISKAESIAHQQGITGKTPRQRQEQVRKYLQGLGYNGDQVSAAMNLAVYGRLGPQDQETAKAYGLNKQMRPRWFASAPSHPAKGVKGHT